jgi:membrane-associated phospholipid phosphatase
MGTHHLEYGFPSTHSTNSVSIALFLFTHLHRLASAPADQNGSDRAPAVSPTAYALLTVALAWYVLSIVLGRLYTAMHSFTDCVVGVLMGAGIWWVHDGYWGLGAGAWVEELVDGHGMVGAWLFLKQALNTH